MNSADQTSVAWAEPAAGEEDATEGEDDDMTGDLVHVAMGEPYSTVMTGLESLDFNEHVREVVLPPPLA